ncbi:MAG: DUF2851 family protein [Akkermansiaceae bacterium]|nr:DUF2851 family protein [Verrucomicrobiales bacterium]
MKTSEMKSHGADGVAEVQGLYGAFSFPERLLQKLWLRGDFDATAAKLSDGRVVKVLHPGKWNHLGGPDFSGARLVIDGRQVNGDVELHLHARDWTAHGHASDRAYDNVVLHVILFPCAESGTRGVGGKPIPILCLLPLLHHGLEEYAAEEAMEQLAGRPLHHAQEVLGALSHQELDTLLRHHARKRWQAKVHFARERIKRLGWEGACHHAALEILGYRFNRAPMLSVAATWPLAVWTERRVNPEEIFGAFSERWSLQGVRPLNHPRLRLDQYARWCAARPDWPAWLRSKVGVDELTRSAAGRVKLREAMCDGVISGSRFDNLMGDGFMPLLAADTGLELESVWAKGYAGDAPESVVRVLRALGVFAGRSRPVSQGPIQGLLGWMLAHEASQRG